MFINISFSTKNFHRSISEKGPRVSFLQMCELKNRSRSLALLLLRMDVGSFLLNKMEKRCFRHRFDLIVEIPEKTVFPHRSKSNEIERSGKRDEKRNSPQRSDVRTVCWCRIDRLAFDLIMKIFCPSRSTEEHRPRI